MSCILNHCHDQVAKDILVVGFYGTAVVCMVVLALLTKSKSIQTAALLISSAWVFSSFAFFYIDVPAYYLLAIMVDVMLAYQFWRMARFEIFPAALCVITVSEVAFLVLALAVALDSFWTTFVLNRVFELTLLYIIGSSIFRIKQLRSQSENKIPSKGWSLQFIAS